MIMTMIMLIQDKILFLNQILTEVPFKNILFMITSYVLLELQSGGALSPKR